MAIIKHKTSRNARYDDVLEYYSFKHSEDAGTGHYEPILDAYGLMQPRENYAVIYVASDGKERDPYLWAGSCQKTNYLYGKNKSQNDRKSHEYIISHPESDREKMTMDDLLDEGKAFAREFLAGYDVLIAVHRDTDNDHIHISIGSVRPQAREKQEWMSCDTGGNVLACELAAGGKHQDTPKLRAAMCNWLLEYTRRYGLEAKDNNAIAEKRRHERYGSKNKEMREALLYAAGLSHDMSELSFILEKEYGMLLKVSCTGQTISVLYPGNKKFVRLRTLGLDVADLTACFIGTYHTDGKSDNLYQYWSAYREIRDDVWEFFSEAQHKDFCVIKEYREKSRKLYFENSIYMGEGKKRKMLSRRKLERTHYFEKQAEYESVLECHKDRVNMQRKYQTVAKGRQQIVRALLEAGGDDKTVEAALNECREAMDLMKRYLENPNDDFESRRLKVAQWSLEQARKRAERYISNLNETEEAECAPQQKCETEYMEFKRCEIAVDKTEKATMLYEER